MPGPRWPRQHAAQSPGRDEKRPEQRAWCSNAEPACGSPRINAADLGRRLTRTRSRRCVGWRPRHGQCRRRTTGSVLGTSLIPTRARKHNSRPVARSTGDGQPAPPYPAPRRGDGQTAQQIELEPQRRRPDPAAHLRQRARSRWSMRYLAKPGRCNREYGMYRAGWLPNGVPGQTAISLIWRQRAAPRLVPAHRSGRGEEPLVELACGWAG